MAVCPLGKDFTIEVMEEGVCCIFGCKANRAGAGQDEKQACSLPSLH